MMHEIGKVVVKGYKKWTFGKSTKMEGTCLEKQRNFKNTQLEFKDDECKK